MPEHEQRRYTLADIVRRTGAKRRSVQLWADAGVIRALEETQHGGSGVHRLFGDQELEIAALVSALAEMAISIGALKFIADHIRQAMAGEPMPGTPRDGKITLDGFSNRIRSVFRRARSGDGHNDLFIVGRAPDGLWFGIGHHGYVSIGDDEADTGMTIDYTADPMCSAPPIKGNPMIFIDLEDCFSGLRDE